MSGEKKAELIAVPKDLAQKLLNYIVNQPTGDVPWTTVRDLVNALVACKLVVPDVEVRLLGTPGNGVRVEGQIE